MSEEPKRLTPKPEVLREIFLKSGNLCAFPQCNRIMMDKDGDFIGQVCHIEAAEEGGQRFNPNMTNEERRSFSNLMLMCYDHHIKTNNVKVYTVDSMVHMKQEHESKFSDPSRSLLAHLKDWTTASEFSYPKNLALFCATLDWYHSQEEVEDLIEDLKNLVDRLRDVPFPARKFLSIIVQRAVRLDSTRPIGSRGIEILLSDVRQAVQLENAQLREHFEILGAHGFTDVGKDIDDLEVVEIFDLDTGWEVWTDLVDFSEKQNIEFDRVVVDLNLDLLDG